jgi:hypothetical protein
MQEYKEMKSVTSSRGGSIQKFIGPEPYLGVFRQNIRNKIKHWVNNQQLAMW